jgi:superfamily I DNA/RNA helicase
VGDDDWAICGWRGATVDNLAFLPRDYPELRSSDWNRTSLDRAHHCGANALIAQ